MGLNHWDWSYLSHSDALLVIVWAQLHLRQCFVVSVTNGNQNADVNGA